MSGKDPSSLSCDTMVLRVKLPQTESVNDIKLEVKPIYIKLSSPIYFLALYLPHSVEANKSSAKWEMDKETIVVTMPIIRETFI
eukprot:c22598_g1_i1 orf=482-733(+)